MKRYRAPWNGQLIGLSLFLTVLCLGASVVTFTRARGDGMWLAGLPIVLAGASALFLIRGYTITPDAILVHRLLWATALPRTGLKSAQASPRVMRGSIRTFGNGGFFSFSGFYWNRALGSYRAYVTDPASTVVLRYSTGKTIVLSPETPSDFVCALGVNPPT